MYLRLVNGLYTTILTVYSFTPFLKLQLNIFINIKNKNIKFIKI